jgi:protoporphyrinogen oxidase
MAKKVLVLGGGMSGLGVAWRLAEKGVPVEVLEALPEIGGLSATVRKGPYRLDYGPHFLLSERPDLLKRIITLFDDELPTFKRSAQLYFHGRYYNYPLTARNVLFQMPLSDAVLSGTSYSGVCSSTSPSKRPGSSRKISPSSSGPAPPSATTSTVFSSNHTQNSSGRSPRTSSRPTPCPPTRGCPSSRR